MIIVDVNLVARFATWVVSSMGNAVAGQMTECCERARYLDEPQIVQRAARTRAETQVVGLGLTWCVQCGGGRTCAVKGGVGTERASAWW